LPSRPRSRAPGEQAAQRHVGNDLPPDTVAAYPNRTFSGTVTQIQPSPQALDHAATCDIVIRAPNPDLLLKPGMQATIRIVKE
jgi:hypothetical protein